VSVIKALLEKPPKLTTASKCTAVNGFIYLAVGFLLIVWPGATQTLFMDPPFAGHEEGLMRVIGLTVVVIGWLYVFGGRIGARQIVAASVIDRLIFVPAVVCNAGRLPFENFGFVRAAVSIVLILDSARIVWG
jgi:hypothetical protein